MGIVLVESFVAGTLLAYFVSHMYQRVTLLNIACLGSAVCTGLYAAATGLVSSSHWRCRVSLSSLQGPLL